jgi:hypothetical protein
MERWKRAWTIGSPTIVRVTSRATATRGTPPKTHAFDDKRIGRLTILRYRIHALDLVAVNESMKVTWVLNLKTTRINSIDVFRHSFIASV